MSWEGHLGGFIVGLLLAYLLKTPHLEKAIRLLGKEKGYNASEDEFLQHFDEDGNFVEVKEEPDAVEEIDVVYDFKENKD